MGKTTIIVLNSRRAVYELVDKSGLHCADRPFDEQIETALGGQVIALMHCNELWKAQRKVTERMFAPKRLDGELKAIQDAEYVTGLLRALELIQLRRVNYLMAQLLDQPDKFFHNVKRAAASIGTIMLYGHRAKEWDGFWASVRQSSSVYLKIPT